MRISFSFFLFLQFVIASSLCAQSLQKISHFNGNGYEDERTYIGDEEKYIDTISGLSVTKINVITEKRYIQYFFVDSIWWYDSIYIDDFLPGYMPIYDYLDDSLMVFYENKLYNDYDAASIVDERVYNEFIYIDSLSGNKSMVFSIKEQKSLKELQIIAYFIHDSLTWKDVHELPLRPFVKQEIDTLGTNTKEYLAEINYPMTYQEIYDTINVFRNYAIDSLTSRNFDPFQYLAELARIQFMFPYFKANIQKAYIRESILNQMLKLSSMRIVEFRKLTGFDFTREPAFNNIIAYKNLNGFNPRCVNLDSIPYYYYDEYDSVRVRMVQINPKGAVSVSFNQIQTESLKAAARNIAYDMDKWYRANWAKIYGRKELEEGEFEPVEEK